MKKFLALLSIGVMLCITPIFTQFDYMGSLSVAKASGINCLGTTPNLVNGLRYGQRSLSFEANNNNNSFVKFFSRGNGYDLFLTDTGVVLAQRKSNLQTEKVNNSVKLPLKATMLNMQLVGANLTSATVSEEEMPSKINYLLGNDPKQYRTNVSSYNKIRYENSWPGISIVYYGNQQQFEYDFLIAPQADPQQIRLKFEGSQTIQLDEWGNLILKFTEGELIHHKPFIYQNLDGKRKEIIGGYVIRNGNEVGFELGDYDKSKELVIDPVLTYSTFLGGTGDESGNTIAVDSLGNIYVAGITTSLNYPLLTPFQPNEGGAQDIFVSKFDTTGHLIYSTYIGGSDKDQALGIAVDLSGKVYLTGNTHSANFPTVNAFQSHCNNCTIFPENDQGDDAFVLQLNENGNLLGFSTYFGGSTSDRGNRIVVGTNGYVYVVGSTASNDFPSTPGVFRNSFDNGDAFVAKFGISGNLIACTAVGGSDIETGRSIAIDSANNIYVSGATYSGDFSIVNGYQPTFVGTLGGNGDAYLAKFNSNLSTLLYSTFLGGSCCNQGADSLALAADNTGNAFISTNTATDTAITKLNTNAVDAASFVYRTSLGVGNGKGVAVDAAGNVFLTGNTTSTSFITIPPANFNGLQGQRDVILSKLDPNGVILFSITFGGSGQNGGFGVAVDAMGAAYVTGFLDSNSANFHTVNAFQPNYGGGSSDAFLAKFIDYSLVQFSSANYIVAENGGNVSITVTRSGLTDSTVSVQYATSNGSATAVSDYITTSGTLTFAPGETSKSFTVPIVNDHIVEDDETINLTLNNSIGAVLGTPTRALIKIIDDDPRIDSFSPNSGKIGIPVTITGKNLSNATTVLFNGVKASFSVFQSTNISAIVPVTSSGVITVITPAGTATSMTSFKVLTK